MIDRRRFVSAAGAALVLAAVPSGSASGQGAAGRLTQHRLEALRRQAGSPAFAAAARGPQGALDLVTGARRVGRPDRATTDDLWHLGSITKSMTATLVGAVVETGALAWTTTVGEALGHVAPDMRAEYRAATPLDLLSHRSGLPGNVPGAVFASFPREEVDARESRRRYAMAALAQEPVGPRGETFTYSNSGFVIAGAILEATLGAPWEALITERLFAPLGMTRAGFGAPGIGTGSDDGVPVGHAPIFGALVPMRRAYPPSGAMSDNPAVLGPAGRVHMPLADLLAYLAAHRDRGPLLRPETWDRLHTPPAGDYALGWVVRPDGSVWHNGSNTLWYAEAAFDRAKGVVAAAAANDGNTRTSRPAVAEALSGAIETVSAP